MSLRHYPSARFEKKALKAGHRLIAGLDEAGRGPLAGPVVAAAVILREYDFRSRIDDSKRLTPKNRLRAYKEILQKSIYSVAAVYQGVIDGINIRNATKLAMEKAVIGLDVRPDLLLIDGTIKLEGPFKSQSMIRGDGRCLSVACASIVAKVSRDRIMSNVHALYPKYGFMNHKGYGTLLHFNALKKYGPTPLHRFSFEPVKSFRRKTSKGGLI